MRDIDAKTAKALFDLVRAAIIHVTGKEPNGQIEVTICPDREYEWNRLAENAERPLIRDSVEIA